MTERRARELRVFWGGELLHVAHLAEGSDVWVGDPLEGPVDYALPCARRRVFTSLRVETDSGDELLVTLEPTPLPPPPSGRRKSASTAPVFASALLHLGVLAALAMHPARTLDPDILSLDRETADALRERALVHETRMSRHRFVESASGDELGQTHVGPLGKLGGSKAGSDHYLVKGPRETKTLTLAAARARIEDGTYGALAALQPPAFQGAAELTFGTDTHSALGHMFGPAAGDGNGQGFGLGMLGTGGGGAWDGIGLGDLGIFGACGCGGGSAIGLGYGRGIGGLVALKHDTKPAVKILDTVDAIGRLPPESVRRVVRAHHPNFKGFCYEPALRKNPGLAGTVQVRFIIDATGAVETVSVDGGTLLDLPMRNCMKSAFYQLSFPEPEGGKVLVRYTLDFAPS